MSGEDSWVGKVVYAHPDDVDLARLKAFAAARGAEARVSTVVPCGVVLLLDLARFTASRLPNSWGWQDADWKDA